MMARTHRLVSGSTALVVTSAVGLPIAVAATAGSIAALSASWPDVDQKLRWIPHRGPTHWPALQAAVLAIPVVAVSVWLPVATLFTAAVAVAAWFGCLMHSCADAMTVDPRGIALLWPISRRGYHLVPRSWRVRVSSKSASERVFFVAWSAFVLSYVYVRFRHQFPS